MTLYDVKTIKNEFSIIINLIIDAKIVILTWFVILTFTLSLRTNSTEFFGFENPIQEETIKKKNISFC